MRCWLFYFAVVELLAFHTRHAGQRGRGQAIKTETAIVTIFTFTIDDKHHGTGSRRHLPSMAVGRDCAYWRMKPVSVLFCCDQSVYKMLPGCDVWDKKRDALRFNGEGPLITHPPCRLWGNLRSVATKAPAAEKAFGPWAVEQVRRRGGVLEHPSGSLLFDHCGCGARGDVGWVLTVDQWHWGHPAAKPTKLFIVGCSPDSIPPIPTRSGSPERCISQGHGVRIGHPLFKSRVTQWEREATPIEFAKWLLLVARSCRA